MKIAAWMKRAVISVKPEDSVLRARELLERHRINQLPVLLDGTLVGIVTDRDLRDASPSVFEAPHRRPARARGADPAAIPVEDVMTRTLVTLAPEAFVIDAARLMRRHRIGAIPIVDDGRVAGILTRSDILDAFIELVAAATPAG
jgi:acetoin utilization protein AcuB